MSKIYLDHNATEPITREHYEEIGRALFGCDANPSSAHSHGMDAKIWVEKSRGAIARALDVPKKQIYFTSGATESNNLIIYGALSAWRRFQGQEGRSGLPHVVTSAVEHASIFDPLRQLVEAGLCEWTLLPVGEQGQISLEALLGAIRPQTSLICLMLANNEVGTVYPIGDWVRACQAEYPHVHFHCDGVQGVGKLADLAQRIRGVDSFSLSGHKIGGLKGVGALYLKASRAIDPMLQGGGQECGLRPGTHNMPGIISLGQRFLALPQIEEGYRRVRELRDLLAKKLGVIPGLVIHGDLVNGLPNTINFHLTKSKGRLVDCLEEAGISVSAGSACSSNKSAGSRVLKSMGFSEDIAANSVRVSLGSATSVKDVERLVRCMTELVAESQPGAGEQEQCAP